MGSDSADRRARWAHGSVQGHRAFDDPTTGLLLRRTAALHAIATCFVGHGVPSSVPPRAAHTDTGGTEIATLAVDSCRRQRPEGVSAGVQGSGRAKCPPTSKAGWSKSDRPPTQPGRRSRPDHHGGHMTAAPPSPYDEGPETRTLDFRCDGCSYGIVSAEPLPACPMCQLLSWTLVPRRTSARVTGAARSAGGSLSSRGSLMKVSPVRA